MNAQRAWVRKQAYAEIEEPNGEVEIIPFSKIACGENPVVECEDWAKDAPQKFIDCWVNEIMLTKLCHLAERQRVGKNTPGW